MPKISPLEFKVLSRYLFDISRISLEEGKEYLVETRLSPILERWGFVSFSELYYRARRNSDLEKEIIDAISTNETYFFRDVLPFELLQYKILPDLIDKRSAVYQPPKKIPIRIWSIGCSTGQELYSIVFTLDKMGLELDQYNLRLLGTDISNAAIAKASYAHYTKFELSRGLTPEQVGKYFDKINDNSWKVKDEFRWLIAFETHNMFDARPRQEKFDIVFCRNVGIYFSPEYRQKMFHKISQILEPDGYLIIGATESLTLTTDRFIPQKYLRGIFYQPPPAAF